QALAAHAHQIRRTRIEELFEADPERFARFALALEGMLLDTSKHLITEHTLGLLVDFARARGLEEGIRRLFAGEIVNPTEGRAAMHMALRHLENTPVWVEGRDVMPEVRRVREKMRDFVEAVRSGAWCGYTGEPIEDIVNIGIGGSDLGPQMACEALRPYASGRLRVHFVSNVDGAHLVETLRRVHPAKTLFVIVSKTFTTLETLANAHSARDWFLACGGTRESIAKHFVAVSTNAERVRAFGIDPEQMFTFWDWVGGRFSMWGAVGLSIALYLGWEHFEAMLAGAQAMDRHFRTAPLGENMPVRLALLELWYRNFLGWRARAVIPYDQYLHRFPAYLQQLEMESLGKSVSVDGAPVPVATGGIVIGEPGTNAQHAFFQLVHQGTEPVPIDFIAAVNPSAPLGRHHEMLLANMLAQAEALMRGRTEAQAFQAMREAGVPEAEARRLAPHRAFPGNRPSTVILLDRLTPFTLGMLAALYEHKVFALGWLWGINPFDQWGVELGKELARSLIPALEGEMDSTGHDPGTRALLAHIRSRREEAPRSD
ncbi:MAG: glucose-6-phosphate isomerase, partial [Zetaproteobacteria bacterium]